MRTIDMKESGVYQLEDPVVFYPQNLPAESRANTRALLQRYGFKRNVHTFK